MRNAALHILRLASRNTVTALFVAKSRYASSGQWGKKITTFHRHIRSLVNRGWLQHISGSGTSPATAQYFITKDGVAACLNETLPHKLAVREFPRLAQ